MKNKILGYLLLSIVAITLFSSIVLTIGIVKTIIAISLALLFTFMVGKGIDLIENN